MADLTEITDFSAMEPPEFNRLVKDTPDQKIDEAMAGPHRQAILNAIFSKFPTSFRADRAGNLNAVIHWIITGAPDGGSDTYELVIADGKCEVSPSADREPKLALTVGPRDFVKVASGNANPVMMFMTGKVKAKGDLGLAANFGNLFETPKG